MKPEEVAVAVVNRALDQHQADTNMRLVLNKEFSIPLVAEIAKALKAERMAHEATLEAAMAEVDSRRIHWSETLKTLPPDNGMVGMANMILSKLADATDAAVASVGWRLVDGEWEVPE